MMSAQVCFPFKGLALQLFWESIRCPSESGHLASNRCAIASTKLKCQTFEWKTDLCRHHVDQPPPLMLPTIPVHYYCVLPWKMNQRARARIARQSGGQCMLKSFSGFKTSINVISAMNSSCIWSDAERSIITALKYYIIVCNV